MSVAAVGDEEVVLDCAGELDLATAAVAGGGELVVHFGAPFARAVCADNQYSTLICYTLQAFVPTNLLSRKSNLGQFDTGAMLSLTIE